MLIYCFCVGSSVILISFESLIAEWTSARKGCKGKRMRRALVCAYGAAFAFLSSSFCSAGYLIVKVEPKERESKAEAKPHLVAVAPDNPNAARLYQLMLSYEWPTALGYPATPRTEESEEAQLAKATADANLVEHGQPADYRFIWVPDTIHELFLICDLQEGRNLVHFPSAGPYYLRTLVTPIDSEAPGYDAMIQHGSQKPFVDHAAVDSGLITGRFPVEKARFSENLNAINARTLNDFFAENVRLLAEVVRHCRTRGKHPDAAGIQSFLLTSADLQDFRRELVIRFNGHYRASRFPSYRMVDKRKMPRKMGFPLSLAEEAPDEGSMIARVVAMEIQAHEAGDALFYRGSNGLLGFVDSALDRRESSGRFKNGSLAYGASLFGGYFLDSLGSETDVPDESSACAVHYMEHSRFAYVLRFPKRLGLQPGGSMQTLFLIPNLGIFGRLFGHGEYFHPRTRVGIQGSLPRKLVSGLLAGSVSAHVAIGLVFDKGLTPLAMAHAVDEFIAAHMQLVTMDKKVVPPDDGAALALLEQQKKQGQDRIPPDKPPEPTPGPPGVPASTPDP